MTDIRPANDADADAILAILNPIIAQTTITFTPDLARAQDVADGLRTHAARGDPYVVATIDNRVVGFAKYGPFRAGAGYNRTAEITLHLAPKAQGRGLGRKLCNTLEAHARAAGKNALMAGISAENDIALAFHRKMGFDRVGLVPQAGYKFGRFIDLMLMQKIL